MLSYVPFSWCCTKLFLFGHFKRKYSLLNELLSLFDKAGSKLLIGELPSILDGSAIVKAQPQDDSKATLAPKVCDCEP